MSTPYTPGYGQPQPPPLYVTPKVNYGWIGESWELYRKAWLPWVLLFLLPVALYVAYFCLLIPVMAAAFAQARTGHPAPATMPMISPAITIISNLLSLAQYPIMFVIACCGSDMALRQVRGEEIPLDSIFRGLRTGLQMLLFGLLYTIASFVGMLACCIGIYASIGLLLPGFAMVADGVPASTALTRSFDGMKVDWINSALFIFVVYLVGGFATILTCYLGLFVFYPMTFIMSALAYRDMIGIPVQPSPWLVNSGPQAPGSWPPAPSTMTPPQQYGQQPGQWPQPGQQQNPQSDLYRREPPFGGPPPNPPQDPNAGL